MNESEWLACEDPARMVSWMRQPRGPFSGFSTSDPRRPNVEASERKLRLFTVAALRLLFRYSSIKPSVHQLAAVQELERFADGIDEGFDDAWADANLPRPRVALGTNAGCQMHAKQVCEHLAGKTKRDTCDAIRDIIGNPFRPVSIRKVVTAARDMSAAALESGATEEVAWQSPWLTPTVLSLATPVYEYRRAVGVRFACNESGKHSHRGLAGAMAHGIFHATNPNVLHHHHDDKCPRVIETDGTLDPLRLAVLADALEESGCDNADILNHLRSPSQHYRGCWVVDLLLGKE